MIATLRAEDQNPVFRHLDINDGLSQNAVFAILQDHKGFMWLGTKDGLNRYDGYEFTVYRHDPFDSTSLSSNYITTLFEDHLGQIWVGTIDGGLNRLQRETETFRRLTLHSPLSQDSIAHQINVITEDLKGNIWIGTRGNGLFQISAQEDKPSQKSLYTQFLHDPSSPGSLSDHTVYALLVDSQGILWIGTGKKLDKFNKQENSSNFEHFTIFTKNPRAPISPSDSSIMAIYEDKYGGVWLGTSSGVGRFDRNDGSIAFYPHHYDIYRYGWGKVTDILEDKEGTLWLATPGELMRFDPAKETYDYFRHDPFDTKSISYNGVSALCRDRSDMLWFGTPGAGVNLYDPKSQRFSTLVRPPDPISRISAFSVRSILEDHSGAVWVSTDVLYRWDRQTGKLKSFETSSERLNDFGNTGVFSMIQTANGELWCATTEGLYRYHPQTGRTRQYKFNPADTSGLRQKAVFTVFEDRKQNIWIVSENYLSRLENVESGRFRHFRYQSASPQNKIVRPVLIQDGKDRFWLGTDQGLLRFDPASGSFKAYRNHPEQPSSLSNNSIKSICADPRQPKRILWIGTNGGGLNRFEVEMETFTHFSEKNGLPNNVVYGILPDDDSNLWISTNQGLSRFNPETREFKNYDVRDGLQSNEFNTGAYFRSKRGELFFGGIKGLNYFYPQKVTDNPHIPEIVITELRLKNQVVSHKAKQSVLQTSISETDHLVLPHQENVITFEFAALDYSTPEKNQFAYKLENFNQDWIKTAGDRSATYTNLPPGEYTFRVKGSNNDGVWNEMATSLRLTIIPPWWKTWWAYILYVVFIIGGLYGVRRYELNRVHLKTELKLEQVEGEKLKELDRLKSHFFANISHEFRTPLTLILGQVESVMKSGIEKQDKSRLQVALRNSRRLLRLINQLLDLSKLEAGSMELKAECRNIVSFLKSVTFSFESLAEQKNITLKFDSEKNNIHVEFEADKMEKVFYNLLSNAFKFTPEEGKVEVEVSVAEREGETEKRRNGEEKPPALNVTDSPFLPFPDSSDSRTAQYVQIRISDTGPGIRADQLPHIFDRFYQADDFYYEETLPRGGRHATFQQGTGIGLALSKELVELHGGQIFVASKEGAGTEFTVCLPISSEAGKRKPETGIPYIEVTQSRKAPDVELQPGESQNSPEPSLPVSHEVVLIVEDNHDVRAYIREQLESEYQLIEAANGSEGIEQAQATIPDLIITDVMMPGMDGYEFSKRIRSDEKTSHIPIIMLTAKAALDDRIEGLETGADAYLTKPFSTKELTVQVRNLILQRRELRKRFSRATVLNPLEVAGSSVDQVFLKKVISSIEEHFEDQQLCVERLAETVNMSVSQLNRKLRALIDQPAGQLIRSMRLQRAADLLKRNAGTVAEICYKVGFSDQANFTRAFKKQFGVAPGEFRRRE